MIPSLNIVRLEVNTIAGWLNITAPALTIGINRADGDVGTLTATVADVTLDPTETATLRPGGLVRVSAKNGTSWKVIYTGTTTQLQADYHPLSRRQVRITLTATDNVAALANRTERRGVATLDALRGLLAGTGIPFNINGNTTAGTVGTVVATNDNASLWSQILATRDSNLAYAWVDQDNRLQVQDLAHMTQPGGPFGSGVFGEGIFSGTMAGGAIAATLAPSIYTGLEVDFNTEQIINSVVVNFLRYAPISDTTTEIPYGPYENAASVAEWGRYQTTVTYQSLVEDEDEIEAFAQDLLNRNALGEVRAKSATVHIAGEHLLPLTHLDLNRVVEVVLTDRTTVKTLRINRVEHQITGNKWLVTFGFDLPGAITTPSVTPGTGVSIIPDGAVGNDNLAPDVLAAMQAITDAANEALSDAADAVEAVAIANAKLDNWTYTGTTTIDGGKIRTDTVTAGQLAADAITAKHTLTGATIQTGTGTNRVLRLNSAGLVAYNAASEPALTFSTSTGALTVKGNIASGSTITGTAVESSTFSTNGVTIGADSLGIRSTGAQGGFIRFDSNGKAVGSYTAPLLTLIGPWTGSGTVGGLTPPSRYYSEIWPELLGDLVVKPGRNVVIEGRTGAHGLGLTGTGYDSGWLTLATGSGWSGTVQYRCLGSVVYLRGQVSRASGTNATVATMPTGYRPGQEHSDLVRMGAATATVAVRTTGAIDIGNYTNGQTAYLTSVTPYPIG